MKSRRCTQSFVLFAKENKIEETSRRMSRRIKSNRKPLREDCRTTSLGVRSIWQLFRDQWRRHDISSYSGRLHFKIRPELNHKERVLNYGPISLQAKSGQTPDILQSSGRREGCKELRQVIWGGRRGADIYLYTQDIIHLCTQLILLSAYTYTTLNLLSADSFATPTSGDCQKLFPNFPKEKIKCQKKYSAKTIVLLTRL